MIALRRNFLHLAAALLFFMTIPSLAQTVVPLWNGPAPQSHGTADTDAPTLTVFLPDSATIVRWSRVIPW